MDRSKRYVAAVSFGVVRLFLSMFAGLIIFLISIIDLELIVAVAALALIPTLSLAFVSAFSNTRNLEAPALTFLIAASDLTLFNINSTFWAFVIGVFVWYSKKYRYITGKT